MGVALGRGKAEGRTPAENMRLSTTSWVGSGGSGQATTDDGITAALTSAASQPLLPASGCGEAGCQPDPDWAALVVTVALEPAVVPAQPASQAEAWAEAAAGAVALHAQAAVAAPAHGWLH